MWYLQEKELGQFRNGLLEINCPSLALERQSPDEPRRYEGPGCIHQTPAGDLRMKVYCNDDRGCAETWAGKRIVLGQLIPKESLYSLKAIDFRGRSWEGRDIHCEFEFGVPTKGMLITGRLSEIKFTQSQQYAFANAYLRMTVFSDIDVPRNTGTEAVFQEDGKEVLKKGAFNMAKFTACGHDFLLRINEHELDIEVSAQTVDLGPNLSLRVIEALQFVAGTPINWSVLEEHQNGMEILRLRPVRKNLPKRYPRPPLGFSFIDQTGCFWQMCERYLSHILGYPEDKWHPLSILVHRIHEASNASPEAFALTCGVAVEGAIRQENPPDDDCSRFIQESLANLQEYLNKWDGAEQIKKRVRGAIRAMAHPRAKDGLKSLLSEGLITQEHYDAWDKLRNSSTHSDIPGSIQLQDFLVLCDKVMVLFNILVFRAIGYSGKYTDYGTLGWPTKDYPAARPASLESNEGATDGEP